MIGAIVGDIIGSRFEWHNHCSKNFDLFNHRCRFTDDSVLTLALCQALLLHKSTGQNLSELAINCMQTVGNRHPRSGFGKRFAKWLKSNHPQPYNSFGNGAAMRVSGCGYVTNDIEEARSLAKTVTAVTHDHPEGIKGAVATVDAIFMAKNGESLETIRNHIHNNYYLLDFTLDEIRFHYTYQISCQKTVPQAIEAFLESKNFEDAIRNAISIGGDSDTIGAITGSIAEAYYGVPQIIRDQAMSYLDKDLTDILKDFEAKYPAPQCHN